MLNVGIIGLGFMGMTHLKIYTDHPGANLVAVADTVKKRLKGDLSGIQGNILGPGETFDFSDIKTYDTVDGILDDPEVDLVSICLPTFLHAENVIKALEKGKHVLCEKPMALSETDLDAMLTAERSAPGRLMIGQCLRFAPEYHIAREIVQTGELGSFRGARFERRSALPTWGGWLRDETKSGGAIIDLSIHDIDFVQYLLGVPQSVLAVGHADLEKGFDYYQGLLRFGDACVNIEGTWYHEGDFPFNAAFDIICDDGTVSFRLGHKKPLTIYRANGHTDKPHIDSRDGYYNEIDYFLEHLKSGREIERCTPRQTACSVRLGLLLKRSRAEGGKEFAVPTDWQT